MTRFALRPVLVVALAKTALGLAFAGRYGWQRDELYYAVAGRHLQGGYVEFPPVTALFAALSRVLFGDSLYGVRIWTLLAGAIVTVLAAVVALELGGGRRAQILAAVVVGFSPLLVATNNLFQPVSFDQLMTMVVMLLALRIALGRGNWVLFGIAAGVGLETKYTLVVPLVMLLLAFLVFRRDALDPRGLAIAIGIVAVLMIPNLLWQLDHHWASVRYFAHPSASATDESRPVYVANSLLLLGLLSIAVLVAGLRMLIRDARLRPLGWAVIGTWVAYFVLGGKSYYASPALLFALAAGSLPLDRWLTPHRLRVYGTVFAVLLLILLPLGLPVLPVKTADKLGIIKARPDYQDELGWHQMARTVEGVSRGANVVVTGNYGEAGALILFGRGLPPVASHHMTFRFWRPDVAGRNAVLVGFTRSQAPFCSGDYRIVARIEMPVDNDERGQPVARCTLTGSLAQVWPRVGTN